LPGDDADLETVYSAQDVTDVGTKDDVRVSQNAVAEFAIHQYKDYGGAAGVCDIEWEGQTNYAPTESTVFLQIYNRDTTTWETIDSDNTSAADTDFSLTAHMSSLTDYKDASNTISCRVYQQDA
jgi:hypothetical protein